MYESGDSACKLAPLSEGIEGSGDKKCGYGLTQKAMPNGKPIGNVGTQNKGTKVSTSA